jgi:hypothetical protein
MGLKMLGAGLLETIKIEVMDGYLARHKLELYQETDDD